MTDTIDPAILDPARNFDFADARTRMVDSQVRPNKVTDPRILASMRRLRREFFLPAALAARAYCDQDVPLGSGRVLTEPMVIARLIQLAAPVAGENALVLAAGPGYAAAVLADCGMHVVALEQDPELLALARTALAGEAPGVTLVSGLLAAGWPEQAPYDLILIDGAVREIPPALAAQLRAGTGRLVTVIRTQTHGGQVVLAQAGPAGLRAQPAFDCATPLIPALLAASGFVF